MDGRPEHWFTKKLRNGVRVYIGDRKQLVPTGTHTYRLTYETNRGITFLNDHDELYWNVTGTGWIFPIRHADATVYLPSGVDAGSLRMSGYTGRQGSREQALRYEEEAAGTASFQTTRPLAPHEGLTIVLGWPKGVVAEPDLQARLGWFVRDNQATVVAGAGILGLLLFYGLAWVGVGRDPQKGVIIPLYQPPKGLSPAGARYVMQMGFDNQTYAAAVIDMAVKGFLKIRQVGKNYTLELADETKEPLLTRGEKALARALFGATFHTKTVAVDNDNHEKFSKARDSLKSALKSEYRDANFRTNALLAGLGGLLSILLLVWVGRDMLENPVQIFAMVVAAAIPLSGAGKGNGLNSIIRWAITAIAGAVFVFTFGRIALPAVVIGLSVGAVNLIFFHLLKAPTGMGRRLMDKIEGFKEYLSVAEKDELNLRNPPDKTPALFEIYLPYALALGVEQQWSEKFAGVLRQAGAEGQTYRPGWYAGTGWNSAHLGGFSHDLGSSLSSSIASASVAPSSSGGSGFGGGGFSGGGGGGGGGGGW